MIVRSTIIDSEVTGVGVCGLAGAVPELVGAGLGYLRVRLLSTPAVLAIMALQAGLLAQKDSLTPLLAILISVGIPDVRFHEKVQTSFSKVQPGARQSLWNRMEGHIFHRISCSSRQFLPPPLPRCFPVVLGPSGMLTDEGWMDGWQGVFNVVGDIFLIKGMKMGVVGAAWATTAAQVPHSTHHTRFITSPNRLVEEKQCARAVTCNPLPPPLHAHAVRRACRLDAAGLHGKEAAD